MFIKIKNDTYIPSQFKVISGIELSVLSNLELSRHVIIHFHYIYWWQRPYRIYFWMEMIIVYFIEPKIFEKSLWCYHDPFAMVYPNMVYPLHIKYPWTCQDNAKNRRNAKNKYRYINVQYKGERERERERERETERESERERARERERCADAWLHSLGTI